MADLPQGLADWTRLAGPAKLLKIVIRRAERGHATERGTLSALPLSASERRDIGLLLGSTWEVSDRPVRLQDLAGRLGEHELTVRWLAEAVHGRPIEENRAVRDQAAERAAAERGQVVKLFTAAGVDQSDVDVWLADSTLPAAGSGGLVNLARSTAQVWKSLPQNTDSAPAVHLARLAADTCQDSHALDSDRLLGRAVARLAATVRGMPRPKRAGRTWRDAWASVGVRCDTVSSRTLALNLPLSGTAAAAKLCAAARGEPIWLTLRALEGDWTAAAQTSVYVCENVTIVEAAADVLGEACPPLVATDGIASGACLDLLAGLANAGCAIHVRADFDQAGFVVFDQVLSVAPNALPWRFDANCYRLATGCERSSDSVSTAQNPFAQLRDLYHDIGIVVHEERLLAELLQDLQHAAAVLITHNVTTYQGNQEASPRAESHSIK
jgi:uncharacterized protein (TIGR02679 family)